MSESHIIFHLSVGKKLCPRYNKFSLSYQEAAVYYCLCHLRDHCDKAIACRKYWKDVDIDAIEDNVKINYYCPKCIDTLTSYQKGTREDCNVDSLLNCLRSFDLKENSY